MMSCLTDTTENVFQLMVETLYEAYADFLKERNENQQLYLCLLGGVAAIIP